MGRTKETVAPRTLLRRGLAALAAAAALSPLAAGAEPAPPPPGAAAVVMLASRSEEETSRLVIGALEAQLSDLPVLFHVSWVPSLPFDAGLQRALAADEASRLSAMATFWLDPQSPGRLLLFLRDPAGDLLLARELESGAAMAETLALVVRSTVLVLLEDPDGRAALLGSRDWTAAPTAEPPLAGAAEGAGGPAAEAGPPPPAPPPEPVPSEPPARRRLFVDLGYRLDVWSETAPAVHGIGIGLEVRLVDELRLRLDFAYVFPFEAERPGVTIALQRYPVRLAARYGGAVGPVGLAGLAGLGVDVVTEDVRAQAPMVVDGDGPEVEVDLVLAFVVEVPLVSWLSLSATVGIAVPFNRVDYAVEEEDGEQGLLASLPVRPTFGLGLSAGAL